MRIGKSVFLAMFFLLISAQVVMAGSISIQITATSAFIENNGTMNVELENTGVQI